MDMIYESYFTLFLRSSLNYYPKFYFVINFHKFENFDYLGPYGVNLMSLKGKNDIEVVSYKDWYMHVKREYKDWYMHIKRKWKELTNENMANERIDLEINVNEHHKECLLLRCKEGKS